MKKQISLYFLTIFLFLTPYSKQLFAYDNRYDRIEDNCLRSKGAMVPFLKLNIPENFVEVGSTMGYCPEYREASEVNINYYEGDKDILYDNQTWIWLHTSEKFSLRIIRPYKGCLHCGVSDLVSIRSVLDWSLSFSDLSYEYHYDEAYPYTLLCGIAPIIGWGGKLLPDYQKLILAKASAVDEKTYIFWLETKISKDFPKEELEELIQEKKAFLDSLYHFYSEEEMDQMIEEVYASWDEEDDFDEE